MIIIPAAGEGRRFAEAGYKEPKHLIPLLGRPMINWVINNVQPLDPRGDIIVATQQIIGKTGGAIETIQKALDKFPPEHDEPLVIANCDQLVDIDPERIRNRGVGHGVVFTFKSASSAHSYVQTDDIGLITGIIEKPAYVDPSWQAVSGVYYFANPAAVQQAVNAVPSASAARAETYFSDALSWMIEHGYSLYAVEAPTAILGTPEDFQRFETAASLTMNAAGWKLCAC